VCVRCKLKFFTPLEIMKDREAAGQYLRMKYIDHRCAAIFPQDEDRRAPHRGIAIVSPASRKLSA
jgi:hypothetical protein